jgi:hypothetical protein
VLVGMGQEAATVDTVRAIVNEIDIVGSFRYANTVSVFQILVLS